MSIQYQLVGKAEADAVCEPATIIQLKQHQSDTHQSLLERIASNSNGREAIIDMACRLVDQSLPDMKEKLCSPKDVGRYLKARLGHLTVEAFAVIYLSARNNVLDFDILSKGTIDGASVYPREIAKSALLKNASSLVIAHNHPSGIAEPGRADIGITNKIKEALSLLDIRLLDHIIVGRENYSFAENNRL